MFTRDRLDSSFFRKSVGNSSTDREEDDVDDGGEMCRICHGARGVLLAPCFCRGSLALVHRACLERWLSECGSDYCELCGYHFNVQRVPKHSFFGSMLRWLATGLDIKQLALDILSFCVLTPMAMIAVYLVTLSMRSLVEPKPFTSHRAPFMLMLSLFSSTLVLVSYYTWLVAVAQQHAGDWYRWWHTNHTVRVMDTGLRSSIRRQMSLSLDPSEIRVLGSDEFLGELESVNAGPESEEEFHLASTSYDMSTLDVDIQDLVPTTQEHDPLPLASTVSSETNQKVPQAHGSMSTNAGRFRTRKVTTKVRKQGGK